MAIEKVKKLFSEYGIDHRIQEFEVSSATVVLAAKALQCIPARIAKTLSLKTKNDAKAVLVVTAGDAMIDNKKYKSVFGEKPVMLTPEEVLEKTGHAIGGVCPFAVNSNVDVYLDQSLKRFHTVYPACGSSNSAIELTIDELEKFARISGWVDVCKNWDQA